MDRQSIKTGIDIIGSVPWGTHFCQFYQTKQDLLDTLVPYFKSGLENNEFCMWITAQPLTAPEARRAMSRAMPDFADRLAKGQIEILPHTRWYLKGGRFDQQRVLDGWVAKLKAALAAGYAGLRLTGNTFWLERPDWKTFIDYEAAVNDVIGTYRMLALCTYSLDKCGATEIMDVIRNHEFALIRKEGEWQLIENVIHKRARQALADSERNYRQLVESLQEGVWVLDRDARTTFVNPRMADMLGYTAEDMLGRDLFSFVDERHLHAAKERMERRRQGIREQVEFEFRRKDGSPLHALVSAAPLTDQTGNFTGVIAGIVDLTHRKRMEEGLRRSEERYRGLYESVTGGIVIQDRNGIITEANTQAREILGLTLDQISGRTSANPEWQATRWDGSPFPAEEHPAMVALRTGQSVRGVIMGVFNPAREERRWILINAEPVRDAATAEVVAVATTFVDVTERAQTEKSLREAERRTQLLAETASELLKSDSPQLVVNSLCANVMNHLDCQVFFNFLVDESAGRLRLNAFAGISSEQAHQIEFLDYGVAVCGCAARDRCRLVAENILETPDPRTELVKSYGVQAYACHPLMAGDRLLGTLSFGTRTRPRFTDEELSLMKAVADLVAIAMQRKQTEEELRETGDYLDNLLNYANAPIIVWDPELHITKFNRAFQRLTGYSEADALGRHLAMLFPQETREMSLSHIARAAAGERWETVEIPILRVDGEVRIVLWNSATIYSDGKSPIATIAQGQDITERKQAEEALRETKEYLDSLLNYANAPIIVWDPAFRITRFNHAFERLTGRKADEVLGQPLHILFPEESRDESLAYIHRTVKGERWEAIEIPILRADGTQRTVLWNSANIRGSAGQKRVATIAQGQDITERKQAEQRLAFQADILSNLFDAVVAVDNAHKVTYWNSIAEDMYGVPRDDAIGRKVEGLFRNVWMDPEDEKNAARSLANEGRWAGDSIHVRKNGEEIHVRASMGMLKDDDGVPVGIVAVNRDRTEWWKANQKLKELNERLRQHAARLGAANRELEAFTYSVSHDLRAPLRSIDGFGLALLEDYYDKLDEQGKDYLRRVRAASQRLGQLIDDLLELSRVGRAEVHWRTVDLSSLAHDVALELQETEPKRRAKFVIAPSLSAYGDATLLRVALQNLLGNAWKFTGKCHRPKIEFGIKSENGERVYFVKDNGVGFDMNYADKMFEPFHRLHSKDEFPGTGIGLATVRRIVDRHGGRVWAQGDVGAGATFHFTLGDQTEGGEQ